MLPHRWVCWRMWQISIVYVPQHTCRHSGSWASCGLFEQKFNSGCFPRSQTLGWLGLGGLGGRSPCWLLGWLCHWWFGLLGCLCCLAYSCLFCYVSLLPCCSLVLLLACNPPCACCFASSFLCCCSGAEALKIFLLAGTNMFWEKMPET